MCGIFGYVGREQSTAQMILDGLKTLEYRGYDSWGISVKHHKKITSEKHVGKIGDASTNLSPSSLGIGHTRWATHGGVTVTNAHPHTNKDRTIAVVHNGIIENFLELKKFLLKNGYDFVTETDTEVIPHMIDFELKKGNGFATSVRNTFNKLTGLNAIVVMYTLSKEIVCVKNGSPLVVGKGKDEYYIASDAVGILKYTRNLYFLEDGELAILSAKTSQILKLPKGTKKSFKFEKINWKIESASLGSYPHFLIKEINEQPQVILNIATLYHKPISALARLIKNANGTFFLGCGTASYAALAGTYLFSRIAKHHVNFGIGSEFGYLEDYLTKKSLIVPISQSGETIDVVQPIQNAIKKGAKTAVITNVLGSTLYRICDFRLLLNAGPEKAVISTKAFTAMISVLIYTASTLAGKQKDGRKSLEKAAAGIKKLLTSSYKLKLVKLAKNLARKEHMYVLGRGLSYPAALEFALKMKETSYVHAEGFAGGELKHGVIALIEKGTPVVVLAPLDETYDEIISNAQEVSARGGYIIGVSPKPHPVFDNYFNVDDVGDATLILEIVVAQLLAYYTALAKGLKDPDKPRNLAKSVTVK
mgnify:CR=1 FL=1